MGKHHVSLPIYLLLVLALAAACALPGQMTATPTPTPTGAVALPGIPSVGGSGNAGGGIGGGSSAGNGGSQGGNGSGNPANPPAPTPENTPDTAVFYDVKQVVTLGGETISGMVCSTLNPFSVLSVTPNVTFTFNFVPSSVDKGTWTYAYTLSKAGESHDASGNYTISRPDSNGTLHLSMSGKDHVVFKGFDGNLPSRYRFDLVPSQKAKCLP